MVVNIVRDLNNRPHHVVDDLTKSNNCFTFTLDLYEFDGRFVKTISKWGYLIGSGYLGVVYVQQGVYPIFLSNVAVSKGGSLTYLVYEGKVSDLGNLVYEDELISVLRSIKVDKPEIIPLQ